MFDCKITQIENIAQVSDIEIISSPLIRNIPTTYSTMVYANWTDNLIKNRVYKLFRRK